MIGSKPVSDLVPGTPGSYFIYATVELDALVPDYVAIGRVRPLDGPLMQAVDQFVADKIRGLAKEISDRRRRDQDEHALEKVHEENRKLDEFKNRYLPSTGVGGEGGKGQNGGNGGGGGGGGGGGERGTLAESIEFAWTEDSLTIGRGVRFPTNHILRPCVRDAEGRAVLGLQIEWKSTDRHIVEFEGDDVMVARGKGRATVWAQVQGGTIESRRIEIEVWNVDHVLLTPRTLEIPLGKRRQIIAEVTNDEAVRGTSVFLNWEHDADDPAVVRIQPSGWITGNRIGQTSVSAGAGDPTKGGVWAKIRPEVKVIANPEPPKRGGGFPRLLLTDRDKDPETGEPRPSDPEQPALYQDVTDIMHNVWWLNLASPDAAFAFAQRTENERLWRLFHAQKVVEMVIQVYMQEEFTKREDERPDIWVNHKAAIERHQVVMSQPMWERLEEYIKTGGGID
jgi:hypothetical protein